MITLAMLYVLLYSCKITEEAVPTTVSSDVAKKLKAAGFDLSEGFRKFEDGYLVEYDIYLTEKQIDALAKEGSPKGGRTNHYRTNNLVSSPRVLSVFMDTGFDTYMQTSFDNALARYNAQNLGITFQRAASAAGADISIFSFFEAPIGGRLTLGYSAGFPSGGNPASPIRLNTYAYNSSSRRVDAATVIAHEIGHAIGFRHTDYMNRTFSCGVEPFNPNEGDAGVGAVHISGTPTTPSANSWMLACSSNTDRPFTTEDQTALRQVYGLGSLNVYAIKKYGTGAGSTEVHILNGENGFKSFLLNTGTIFHSTNDDYEFLREDMNRDGYQDIILIKKKYTGTNSTEIHVLNGATGFQSFLIQTGTALHETDQNFTFGVGDYNRDGIKDIYAIKKSNSGTNRTEIHVLNGASGYQNYLLNTGSVLDETHGEFDFEIGDINNDGYLDVIGFLKRNTGSNSIEIHALSGRTNFQSFAVQTGTVLPEVAANNVEFGTGDLNRDGILDVFLFLKSATGTNSTEIHVLNGATGFQSFLIQTGTALHETGKDFQLLVGR